MLMIRSETRRFNTQIHAVLLCRIPDPASACFLSPPSRLHDGILQAPQASLYEFSGSVGPRPVSRQLAFSSDLQHQCVEQVSCGEKNPSLLECVRNE